MVVTATLLLFHAQHAQTRSSTWNRSGKIHRDTYCTSYIYAINELLLNFTYRHLNQLQLTADGNYHLGRYTKNTDPDDISLYDGKAYFPREDEYKEYLKGIPANSKEASWMRGPSMQIYVTDQVFSGRKLYAIT